MTMPFKPILTKLIASLQHEKWIRIWGRPYDLRILVLQVIFTVLLIAFIVGAFFYTNKEISERRDYVGGEFSELESKISYREDSETPEFDALHQIMQLHEYVLGFNKINSLLIQGEMFDGHTSVNLKMMAKPPESYFQLLEMDNKELKVTFINGKLEYDQNSALINTEDERLAGINKVLMVMECAIPLPAWLYVDQTNNLYLKRKYDEIYNGRECAVVENSVLKDTIIRHYIDLATGQELSRQSEVKGDRLRVDYEELKEVTDVFFPTGYQVFLNGSFVCKATFDSIQINRGLPTFLFTE